jgi:Na+/H+-dicarboxylate symporter
VLLGLLMSAFSWGKEFVIDWIAPFGTIFIRLLKLIAIPLIFVSLIKGISDLKDISSFRDIGFRTIMLYISTTVVAVTIGLLAVNVLQPGAGITEETIGELTSAYTSEQAITSNIYEAVEQASSPLNFLVDIVPDNIFAALGNNSLMLQVIFFSILFGICMLLIDPAKARPIAAIIDGLNAVVLMMVDLIMWMAPFAVFALLSQIIVSTDNVEILKKLLYYGLTVLLGLTLMLLFYLLVLFLYTKTSPRWFLRGIAPAHLLAFSTSSSAATLPVTMERVTYHLGG